MPRDENERARRMSYYQNTHDDQDRIRNNFTGNKFGKYINRSHLEDKVISYLKNDFENYLLISGLGGMGKSFLIYSVLNKILNRKISIGNKKVDSIIWITDSYKPGELDIRKFIDEINRVYAVSSSTQFCNDFEQEKRKAFEFLNQTNNSISILVIDNFETIKDEELRHFVFNLPTSCKVILTCKFNCNTCISNKILEVQNRQCIHDMPIPSFTDLEWKELFLQIKKSNDIVDKWASRFSDDQLDMLLNVTRVELSGIPFPLERILLQISEYNLFNEDDIRELIHTAIEVAGDYDRMISYSWNKLDNSSKLVLLASALNGHSDNIDLELVSKISGLKKDKSGQKMKFGSELQKAISQCTDYKLLETENSGASVKYYLQKIVYRFIINQIENDTSIKENFENLFSNWINYYIDVTSEIGLCYNDTKKMQPFDEYSRLEALLFVLEFCYKNRRFSDYIKISYNMRYYFYTRSIWEVGDECIHIKRAIASKEIGDSVSELEAYVYYINIASKYGQFEKIQEYIERAQDIITNEGISKSIEGECYFRFKHAMGLYMYHKGNNIEALKIWNEILEVPICTSNIHDIDAAKKWHTKCLLKISDITDVHILELLSEARSHNFERAIVDYTLMIVRRYIRCNNMEKAKEYMLSEELRLLIEKTNDVLYRAEYYLCHAVCSLNDTVRDEDFRIAKDLIEVNGLEKALFDDIQFIKSKYSVDI